MCHASFHHLQDRNDEAVLMWRQVVDFVRQADDRSSLAIAQVRYAAALVEIGRASDAAELLDRGICELENAGEQLELAFGLYWRGSVEHDIGHYEASLRDGERGLALAKGVESLHAQYLNYRIVGQALAHLGRHAEGVEACERAVLIARKLGQEIHEIYAGLTLAFVCTIAGHYDRARTLSLRQLEMSRRLANVRGQGLALGMLGDAYHGRGCFQDAAHALAEALQIFRDHANGRYHSLCLLKLGYAYQRLGRHREAAECLTESLQLFEELRLPHYVQRARDALSACSAAEASPRS